MLTKYTKSLNSLKKGSNLPDIELVNYDDSQIKISSLIKAPTAISFWSQTYYDHFTDSHKKLEELKLKYPEITFITINIDDYDIEKTKKLLVKYDFDLTNEYQFKNPKSAMDTLAIYPMTKTIIIDKNKQIVNGNANIFSIHFEEQLLGLINR
jgi:peroxiredoxin